MDGSSQTSMKYLTYFPLNPIKSISLMTIYWDNYENHLCNKTHGNFYTTCCNMYWKQYDKLHMINCKNNP